MTSPQDRRLDRLSTSREYEVEAEQTRRRLADNLDALSDRLTPGQVFDEMLTYSRAGGGAFARALTNAMRQNPLPSFLIGAGCVMFLSEKMGARPGSLARAFRASSSGTGYDEGDGGARASRARDAIQRASERVSGAAQSVSDAAGRVSDSATSAARDAAVSAEAGVQPTTQRAADRASDAADAVSGTIKRAAGAVGDTASDAADRLGGATGAVKGTLRQTAAAMTDTLSGAANAMQSKTHDLRDQAAGTLQHVGRGAAGAAGTLRETASSMGGKMVDTAGRTRRAAFDAARTGRETAASFIAEQPLLSAAIGVAVGAALASLLPATRTENEWLGEASDRVKGAAGEAVGDGLDSARNVASKAAERVKSAAREEGFSPSAVADAARRLDEGFHEGAARESMTGAGNREQDLGSSVAAEAAVNFGEAVRRGRPMEPATGSAPQELADVRHTGP